MKTKVTLQVRAAELRAADIERWNRFLEAYAAYAEEAKDTLVRSPVDILTINQGRAQFAADLVKILTDAPSTADKLTQR
jgi:hypothetical protein